MKKVVTEMPVVGMSGPPSSLPVRYEIEVSFNIRIMVNDIKMSHTFDWD